MRHCHSKPSHSRASWQMFVQTEKKGSQETFRESKPHAKRIMSLQQKFLKTEKITSSGLSATAAVSACPKSF
eukprot:373680-Hanusia_phi.AAC.2